MGHFGMGGSSSFAYTEHATLIVSRKHGTDYHIYCCYDENDHDPSISKFLYVSY